MTRSTITTKITLVNEKQCTEHKQNDIQYIMYTNIQNELYTQTTPYAMCNHSSKACKWKVPTALIMKRIASGSLIENCVEQIV